MSMKPMALNMSKMKKVDGDKHASTFLHDDGHIITIAHSKLPALQRKQLEKMPIHMMAEGGAADTSTQPTPQPSPAVPAGQDKDKADKFSNSLRQSFAFAEGGSVGVHHSDMEVAAPKSGGRPGHTYDSPKMQKTWAGQSKAGSRAYDHAVYKKDDPHSAEKAKKDAVSEHHRVLGEMKAMSKPKLQGLASGGEVKGVHKQYQPQYKDKESLGESKAGNSAKLASESGSEKGKAKYNEQAYVEHREVLRENRKIHPKLQGLADGGQPDLSVADPNAMPQVPVDPVNLPQPSNTLLSNGSMNAPAAAQAAQQGILDQAKVDAAQGAANANVEKGYIDAQQANQKRQQDLYNNVAGHVNDFSQYIQKNPIDPCHYQESMGTGKKVTTAIGLLLGGFGGGAQGGAGANPAMDFFNKQIDRDIAAQQARSDQQKTVLGAYQDLYGKGDAALAAAKASQIDIYKHQINQVAAQLGTPQAMANAQKLIGNLTPVQNKLILDSSGSIGRGTLPMNNGSNSPQQMGGGQGPAIQRVNSPQGKNPNVMQFLDKDGNPQDTDEETSPILGPNAQSQLDATRYQPKFKDMQPQIQEQYENAKQADRISGQLHDVMGNMQGQAQEGGTLGYMRRHDPLSSLPFGIGQSLHDLAFQPFTDTQNNRSYDANKTRIKSDVANALKGTNVGSQDIEDIVNKNSPEHNDTPEMLKQKEHNLKVFIKNGVKRGLLQDAKIAK